MEYYEKSIRFDSLYRALKKCCHNVRWKDSVVGYESNGLKNTLELSRQLSSGKYKLSPYQVFTIYEPKRRVIVATRIRDRQVQRALCDNGLYDDIAEHFIRDNVACQKGRGTDDAFRRMKTHLHRYYRRYGANGWVLKCDIRHFFPSTRHDVAKAAVQRAVQDGRVADYVCTVIDSFGGERGIGLGSEISQLVELLVLNDLDHYIKERLGIRYYIRYMDDFVLIHHSKAVLEKCLHEIRKKLTEIGLELNGKTTIHQFNQGVKFLKWTFKLTDTGRVLMLMDKRKLSKFRRRLRKLAEKERSGIVPPGTARDSLQSFLAHAERGDTYLIRRRMIDYYNGLGCGFYD